MIHSIVMAAILLAGCTVIRVREVDRQKFPLTHVCIERNERVQVDDFLDVVEDGFRRHGITTSVHSEKAPATCEYVLTYTARRSWDLATFMRSAELRLDHQGVTIGKATYRHRGGFGLNKFAGTASKIDPVIDRLLAGPRGGNQSIPGAPGS